MHFVCPRLAASCRCAAPKSKTPAGIRRTQRNGVPRESPRCGIFWGRGGMTERYEKSPPKGGLFEWSAVHSDVVGQPGLYPRPKQQPTGLLLAACGRPACSSRAGHRCAAPKSKTPAGIRRTQRNGVPRESPRCGIFWGRGGMTERYEKSPPKGGLFEWSAVHSDVVGQPGLEPGTKRL